MVITQIGQYKYTSLKHKDEVTKMPLMRNIFGVNNKMYANLGSYSITEEMHSKLRSQFSEAELRFSCVNRLFELVFCYRDFDDEYHTVEGLDFKPLYNLVVKDHSLWDSCYVKHKEESVLYVPLGSDVLYNACNYAAQEIELLKLDNFMNSFGDNKHLNNFINLFG